MLTNFDKYNEEMEKFEKSALHKKAYRQLVHYLYLHKNREQVFSSQIEAEFGLKGAQVRDIFRHARRKGHPLISTGRGYSMHDDYFEYIKSLEHLEQRAMSMLFTISKAKKNCRLSREPQLDMFKKRRAA